MSTLIASGLLNAAQWMTASLILGSSRLASAYVAPCDLTTARRAVNAYQDALTATIARNGR